MSTTKLRVAVVGLGNMGRNHVRVLSELPQVELVGLADPSEASRKALRFVPPSARVWAEHRELLAEARPDAVVVAVPSELHRAVGIDCFEAGAHVLVEKPIAKTLEDGQALCDAATRTRKKLMVGQVERFNPAVIELRRRVHAGELGQVFQLQARRLSPFPARIADVGVVLDLATHDIDAMHHVTGSRVVRAYAETARMAHKTCEDLLSGLLRFESGPIGMLDVSWLSPKKLRELWVVGEGGTFVADYLTQDLSWFKNGRVNESYTAATNFSGAVEGDFIRSYIPKKEPLRAELEAFVSSVLEDGPVPVTGEDGLAAIRVALDLVASGSSHGVRGLSS